MCQDGGAVLTFRLKLGEGGWMKDFEKRGREQARQYLEGQTKRARKGMTANGNK